MYIIKKRLRMDITLIILISLFIVDISARIIWEIYTRYKRIREETESLVEMQQNV